MITYQHIQKQFINKEQFCSFLKKLPFGRYLTNRKIDIDLSADYEYSLIIQYLEKGSVFIALNDDNEILGIIGFHFSDWDTEVFQKRMAVIQYFLIKEQDQDQAHEKEIASHLINIFHNWCDEKSINVVIVKLDTQYFIPLLILQQNGYILYECITFRTLEVSQDIISKPCEIIYRYALDSDREQLKTIALKNTFKKSHFFLDSNFDLAKVELMYSNWIENALSSKKRIVIIEEKNQIAGVFIYQLVDFYSIFNKKFAIWEFAAVDSNFRDKGIGMKLFKATIQSCIRDGVDVIDSSLVEKNIVSQRFHDILGFQLTNTMFTLHKWF